MERLWTHDALADRRDELDLSLNGDYLELHGGRRGVGEVLVRQFGYAAAARYLDNSEEQVREAYQHIEAAERRRHGDRGVLADGQSCEREMTVLKVKL